MAKRANGEGGLFERKSGRHKGKWLARVLVGYTQEGKPIRKDYLCKTQAEAKAKLRGAISDQEKGRDPILKAKRLSEYLDYWLENRVKGRVSSNTYSRYKGAVNVHVKADPVARMQLPSIKGKHINDLLDRSVKGREGVKPAGPSTITNIRAVLSAAFEQAVKEDEIHDNPVRKSDPPRQSQRDLKFLNAEDARKLLDASKGHTLEALITTAIYTGMRLSELLGLTWDRIDLKKQTITVDRQLQRDEGQFCFSPLKRDGGRRSMPLSKTVVEHLSLLKAARMLNEFEPMAGFEDLVFVTPTGQPFHRKTVLDWTKGLMKKAGVSELDFHTLRHTCASILINNGADALQVQRQLGHANVRITLTTYSHLFEERLHDNVSMLDKALGRG